MRKNLQPRSRPLPRRRIFLVNEHNHHWVADATGYTEDEIDILYQQAQREGVVCWVQEPLEILRRRVPSR